MGSSTSERRAPRGPACLAALLLVTLARTAAAGAAPPSADGEARAAAQAQLVEGVALLRRGSYAEALACFQRAYALVPSPNIHYDFGLAYMGLGRDTEALAAFDAFLTQAPRAPADKRAKAERNKELLRARLGPPKATPMVEAPLPAAPVALPLPAAPSSPPPVLAAAPPAPAAAPSPAVPIETAPEPLAPEGRPRLRTWALVTAGTGVALLGAGVVFGLLAQQESNNLSKDSDMGKPPNPPVLFVPSKESDGIAFETAQIIFLAAGTTAVAAGVVLYALDRRRAARMAVAPVVSPSSAGANVAVRF